MRKSFAAAVLAGALTFSLPAAAADYAFDKKGMHASITWRIKHLGYSWMSGRFDDFDGTLSFDDKTPDASKVKVEIDVNSISSNHAERDKHLRSPDYLDTAAHPKATFESTSIAPSGDGKAKITGKFTFRGVTKDITIDAEKVGSGPDPWGGERAGFTGTTQLTLADFKMKKELGPSSAIVYITLDVEGVKK
jgi:polyisoprenoid-binding protein YceI